MKNEIFDKKFAINIYNKNKYIEVKEETNLVKGDYFVATLSDGLEFALCKAKTVKRFKSFKFIDELEVIEFNFGSSFIIQATKKT